MSKRRTSATERTTKDWHDENKWLSGVDHALGNIEICSAVKKTVDGQFELEVTLVRYSNPVEPKGSESWTNKIINETNRRYRADKVGDLLKIGIAEVQRDSSLKEEASEICAIVREAVFDAQDEIAMQDHGDSIELDDSIDE